MCGYAVRMFRKGLLAIMLSSASSSFADPLVIAHRGGAHAAPENTIAAFVQGWADGADGAEGDFYLSADGHVVCIHDRNTKKLANKSIDVTKSTLEQLKALDVGYKKNKKFTGERVPTLEEVMATVPEGKKLFIEIKDSERIVAPIKKILDASSIAPEQIAIISFDRSVIRESKKQMPDIKAYWIFNQKTFMEHGATKVIEMAKAIGADGIDTEAHKGVSKIFVKMLRNAGLEVHCWTVNDAKTGKRFAEMGFDSITTDRPKLILEALGR